MTPTEPQPHPQPDPSQPAPDPSEPIRPDLPEPDDGDENQQGS
jgi:hypothetical protein